MTVKELKEAGIILTAEGIMNTLTSDGNIEVDGDEAIRIINRLMDLQEQKLNKVNVSNSDDIQTCKVCGVFIFTADAKMCINGHSR